MAYWMMHLALALLAKDCRGEIPVHFLSVHKYAFENDTIKFNCTNRMWKTEKPQDDNTEEVILYTSAKNGAEKPPEYGELIRNNRSKSTEIGVLPKHLSCNDSLYYICETYQHDMLFRRSELRLQVLERTFISELSIHGGDCNLERGECRTCYGFKDVAIIRARGVAFDMTCKARVAVAHGGKYSIRWFYKLNGEFREVPYGVTAQGEDGEKTVTKFVAKACPPSVNRSSTVRFLPKQKSAHLTMKCVFTFQVSDLIYYDEQIKHICFGSVSRRFNTTSRRPHSGYSEGVIVGSVVAVAVVFALLFIVAVVSYLFSKRRHKLDQTIRTVLREEKRKNNRAGEHCP